MALAGTFAELVRAAAAGVRVRRAILSLHQPEGPLLTEWQRDELWKLFQVPVFALLLDASGRVIAFECEAQNGLHLGSKATAAAGLFDLTPCACGRPGPRLIASRIAPAENAGEPLSGLVQLRAS